MMIGTFSLIAITVLLFVYLIYALLRPENF
ncbi:K(+)-transporting ATPase subunit F [Edaphobacter acidisoli]